MFAMQYGFTLPADYDMAFEPTEWSLIRHSLWRDKPDEDHDAIIEPSGACFVGRSGIIFWFTRLTFVPGGSHRPDTPSI